VTRMDSYSGAEVGSKMRRTRCYPGPFAGESDQPLVLVRIELIRTRHRNPTGVSVCRMRMVAACAASTSGRRS
jgi:hypothetical protein